MVLPKIETAVWMALSEAAHAIVTSPVIPIYEPGTVVSVTPPYILLSDVRNDKTRWGIAGENELTGTLMATVHWPLSKAITHTQLMEIGGTIAGNFPSDRCLQWGGVRVRIWRDSDVLAPYIDGAFRVMPVRIFWTTRL